MSLAYVFLMVSSSPQISTILFCSEASISLNSVIDVGLDVDAAGLNEAFLFLAVKINQHQICRLSECYNIHLWGGTADIEVVAVLGANTSTDACAFWAHWISI